MRTKVYLPLYCAKLEHVDPEGRTLQEDVYRVPLVFQNMDAAKACFEDVVSKMDDTRLVEIRQAGWFIPETGRVVACSTKKKEVKSSEKICIEQEKE